MVKVVAFLAVVLAVVSPVVRANAQIEATDFDKRAPVQNRAAIDPWDVRAVNIEIDVLPS